MSKAALTSPKTAGIRRLPLFLVACAMGAWLCLGGCSKEPKGEEGAATGTASETMTQEPRLKPGENRLALEKSPYLLQHKDNPVDWYPWGEEAFEAALREDKPIFLSIGYSTCHWCHVMERESFEDTTVAKMMNKAFINIKVDREERPDIDQIYMTICQAMTQTGGWPLTIIMTPDRRPFWAGTYIPKQPKYNHPGMLTLIPQIENLWKERRNDLVAYSDKIISEINEHVLSGGETGMLGEHALDAGYDQLKRVFDAEYGGFGGAPKFPSPHQLMFLLRYWKRSDAADALAMTEKTLDAMAAGGIYDHVGYGFARYSTDARWFAPHFEKMLYDQAMLAMAYAEAYAATGKAKYRRIADEIFTYVARDMTDAGGGFYSAEDADSDGIEGKFYLWTEAELRELLDPADADLFIDVYGVDTAGNFHEEVPGGNILYLRRPLAMVAGEQGTTEDALRERLDKMRETLFEARERRVHPHKDDKILTDWNGLMIAAYAKAGRAFSNPDYIAAAEKAAGFILDNMVAADGSLHHRYRDGEAAIESTIDDYAFLTWGLLELYEATFRVDYLQSAMKLSDHIIEHFWDENLGGFFFTPDNGEELILRMKDIYDRAVPAGNSVAMLNLLRIGRISADPTYEDYAQQLGSAAYEAVTQSPGGMTQLLCALDFAVGPSFEVIVVGDKRSDDTQAMTNALNKIFVPNKVVVFKPTDEASPVIEDIADYTRAQSAIDGKATAYVCRNYACDLPTNDVKEMLGLLGAARD